MAMVVKNNMSAINTLNTLNKNSSALSKSLQKVSSGMKINSAADDASGYAISERMRVQIRSLDQANSNTQNGSSMMKVAEGAVSSTVDILKTLKEKVINAANDTNTDSDRQTIQKELNQSIDQINDNANVTFNGKYLVDGSKNTIGNATYTALTNQSLATDTKASDALTSLKSRSGDSLELTSTDKVTVSYVQAGKTYSTTFQVGTKALQDIFTTAEQIDTTSKIFADATNTSVRKAMGNKESDDVAAKIKAADTTLYGATEAGTIASGVTSLDDTDALYNGIAAGDLVASSVGKVGAKVVDDLAAAIATYNAANPTAKIDVKAFGNAAGGNPMIATYDETTVANTKLNATLTNADKIKFMQTLSADANYSAFVKSGGTKATDANTAYTTFLADKATSDGYHTAVVSSSTVGLAASNDAVTTANGDKGITITANKEGVNGQISGLNISVTDSQGNVKKSANASLDAFSETIRAQNKSADNAITLQVGSMANQSIKVGLTDMRSEALGLQGADGTKLNISTQVKANAAVNVLDNALQKALDQQTTIGSIESRLEYTSSNLTTASTNVQASESTIRDADMAKEMTEYTKNNVLLQAAQSMLSQANQNSSSVLSLLK